MLIDRATKRQQSAEMWARHYPRPIAELIAVVAQPFDDDISLADVTIGAQKAARKQVRELFTPDGVRPSGGQIESELCEIATRLLLILRDDEAASLAAERLAASVALLGAVSAAAQAAPIVDELVVPDAATRLDGPVPFAMWR